MDDGTPARLDHPGNQPPVDPHRGQQVDRELTLPVFVIEHGESARRRGGAPQDLDEDVQVPEGFVHGIHDPAGTLASTGVGGHEQIRFRVVVGHRAGGRHHPCASLAQPGGDGRALSLRAAGHQCPAAGE